MAWLGLVSTRPWAAAAAQLSQPSRQAAGTHRCGPGRWLVTFGFAVVWVVLALVALPVLAAALLVGGLLAAVILWFPHSCTSAFEAVLKNKGTNRLGPQRRLAKPDLFPHLFRRIPAEPRVPQTRPWR